ncbi:uncharacterized protein LOC141674691 [Apium graveolens]|uniref:uncharacterized protein LOC141674691 n=1 Tax=Apium graveolens TaxID=4045 RepID=UPI003D79FE3E
MIQRIPGVPKPLEKATPMSFANSPFSDEIAQVEIPKQFAIPSMKVYDGSKDPQEHVAQYKQRMFTVPIIMDLKEPCMYKRFGSTLTRPALQWFVNLPNGRIGTFADLVDAFNLQFASSRRFEKMTSDLYKIYQKYREPLRDYLTRFNKEKVTITNCNTPTVIEAIRRGLGKDSSIYDNLTKYPCKMMDDVQEKALAQSPTVLVKKFEKLSNVVRWPPKTTKPKSNPDSRLWCEFHADYGHKANDCVALRKEIEALVKKGYLTEYISTQKCNYVRNDRTTSGLPPPPSHYKVINFIAGGSEVCRATYSQAKRGARGNGVQVSRADVSTYAGQIL